MKYSSHPSIKLVWICGKFNINFVWTSSTLHFKWNYRQTVVQNFSTHLPFQMCKHWIFHKIFWNSIHELTYKCWIIVMTIKLGIMDYICEKEIFSIVFARLGKISCANGLRNINNHFFRSFSIKGMHKHWWIGVSQTIVEPSSKIKYSMENILMWMKSVLRIQGASFRILLLQSTKPMEHTIFGYYACSSLFWLFV